MAQSRMKLLIVDDEPDVCTAVQSYFGKRNFIVSSTGSGAEALSMIKASRPDVVLLDVMLHDIDGIELLKRLRSYDQETRVIIITGQEFSGREVQTMAGLGVKYYKQKPLILTEVEKIVRDITGADLLSAPDIPLKPAGNVLPGEVNHKLVNVLGIIRGKCEVFNLNLRDGFYKDRSAQEIVALSTEILDDIQRIIDKAQKQIKKL